MVHHSVPFPYRYNQMRFTIMSGWLEWSVGTENGSWEGFITSSVVLLPTSKFMHKKGCEKKKIQECDSHWAEWVPECNYYMYISFPFFLFLLNWNCLFYFGVFCFQCSQIVLVLSFVPIVLFCLSLADYYPPPPPPLVLNKHEETWY